MAIKAEIWKTIMDETEHIRMSTSENWKHKREILDANNLQVRFSFMGSFHQVVFRSHKVDRSVWISKFKGERMWAVTGNYDAKSNEGFKLAAGRQFSRKDAISAALDFLLFG